MSNKILTIRSTSDIDTLKPGILNRRGRIVMEIPQLDEMERRYWEQRINRYFRACGCEIGAAMTVLSVLGYALFLFLQGGLFWRMRFTLVAVGLAVVLISAVTGKGVGLLYARHRLSSTVSSVRRLVQSRISADGGAGIVRGTKLPLGERWLTSNCTGGSLKISQKTRLIRLR